MPYEVHLKRSAEKELTALPREVHQKIVKRLLSLEDNPRPHGAKEVLESQRPILEKAARILLEKEVLEGEELREILNSTSKEH
jgi:hypothetical protein